MTNHARPASAPRPLSPADRRVDDLMLATYRLVNTIEGWHADLAAADTRLAKALAEARAAADALVPY
jgi:hypothetical protein